MHKNIQLELPPEIAFDEILFHQHIKNYLQIKDEHQLHVRISKRSIDARSRNIKVNINADIFIDETPATTFEYQPEYKEVSNAQQAIIIGAGPAGLFAALRLIELGIKPIILERGKEVQERRRDLAISIKTISSTKILTIVLEKAVQALTATGNYIPVLKSAATSNAS